MNTSLLLCNRNQNRRRQRIIRSRKGILPIEWGIPAALAGSHVISSMIYGVTANDLRTILLSCSILLAVAALAACVPARRASRVDPMAALRSE